MPRGNLPSVPIFETPTRSRHLYGYMQPRRKAYYRQSSHSFPNNGEQIVQSIRSAVVNLRCSVKKALMYRTKQFLSRVDYNRKIDSIFAFLLSTSASVEIAAYCAAHYTRIFHGRADQFMAIRPRESHPLPRRNENRHRRVFVTRETARRRIMDPSPGSVTRLA